MKNCVFKKIIFVIGIQSDKDAASMLGSVKSVASSVIFTKSKNEKATEPNKLFEIFQKINKNKKIKAKIIENSKKAFDTAKKSASKKDLVVATGSLYLAGEIF